MKTIFAFFAAIALMTSAASAVTWSVVSASIIVKTGSTQGNVVTTKLSSRSYLNAQAQRLSVPVSDLFIGLNEETGTIHVVRRSNETIVYNVVSGITQFGRAANASGSGFTFSGSATVSSLNTDFVGFVFDTVTRRADNSVRTFSRSVIGGFQNQTIRGTFKATGRKIIL